MSVETFTLNKAMGEWVPFNDFLSLVFFFFSFWNQGTKISQTEKNQAVSLTTSHQNSQQKLATLDKMHKQKCRPEEAFSKPFHKNQVLWWSEPHPPQKANKQNISNVKEKQMEKQKQKQPWPSLLINPLLLLPGAPPPLISTAEKCSEVLLTFSMKVLLV